MYNSDTDFCINLRRVSVIRISKLSNKREIRFESMLIWLMLLHDIDMRFTAPHKFLTYFRVIVYYSAALILHYTTLDNCTIFIPKYGGFWKVMNSFLGWVNSPSCYLYKTNKPIWYLSQSNNLRSYNNKFNCISDEFVHRAIGVICKITNSPFYARDW